MLCIVLQGELQTDSVGNFVKNESGTDGTVASVD